MLPQYAPRATGPIRGNIQFLGAGRSRRRPLRACCGRVEEMRSGGAALRPAGGAASRTAREADCRRWSVASRNRSLPGAESGSSPVPCGRRPGRQRYSGVLETALDPATGDIVWGYPVCGQPGRIHHGPGSRWDGMTCVPGGGCKPEPPKIPSPKPQPITPSEKSCFPTPQPTFRPPHPEFAYRATKCSPSNTNKA